jgi:uncharacterized protein
MSLDGRRSKRAVCGTSSRNVGRRKFRTGRGGSLPPKSKDWQTSSVPRNCIVDSGALVALLDPREERHSWARETFARQPDPWFTCEAALSEALFLLQEPHSRALEQLLRKGHLRLGLNLAEELTRVLDLLAKYADVPMSLADACLVRMSEILPDPVVLTTDDDFRIYRRHSRQVVPCLMP